MSLKQDSYLSEMGITQWGLIHPERLQGMTFAATNLPATCRLLIVSLQSPDGELFAFVQNVAKSFGVDIEEIMFTHPSGLARLGEHYLEWVWFAGCDEAPLGVDKVLISAEFNEVNSTPALKKALWQQILANKEK